MKDFALIEMLFSFGVVLALAIWELWRTPRPDEPDEKSASAKLNSRNLPSDRSEGGTESNS